MNARRVLVSLVSAAALLRAQAADPAAEVVAGLARFMDVFTLVQREAADKPASETAIYQGALPGALRQLDPHSIFFDPDNFKQLQEMEKSVRRGFGTIVQILPGRVVVLQTQAGSPGARAGLLPGDEILAVNNYVLSQFEPEQIIQLLTQARQQAVRLAVRRQSMPRILEFDLTPASLETPSVDRAFLLAPGQGFIRVTSFERNTAADFRSAVEKLGGAKLKSLIIDLRNNPGGILPAALEIASMFLEPGRRIISVKGRSKETDHIDVPANAPAPYPFPVAVLMNAKSASASEVVAAALQDHKRAVVAGDPSFGKGLVQNVFPNKAGDTATALTIAYYYSPNGRNLQRPLKGAQLETPGPDTPGGVKPDVPTPPAQMTRLRYVLEQSGAITAFATEYTRRTKIDESFVEVPLRVVGEFQGWLAANKIQPRVAEWTADAVWIRQRLHQEILNLGVSVEKGDEVELKNDPLVKRALDAISR